MSTDFWSKIDLAGLAQKAVAAILILVVTWVVAKVVKWAFEKLAGKVPALQRAGADGQSLGASLGQIGSLLVWLFGLVALLQLFGLSQVLAPIQQLLTGVFGFLPNLIGAGVVFFIGAMVAKIVRQLVQTALGTVPFDKWFNKAGGDEVTGSTGATISKTIATVLYALIMIVVAISALQILGIQSISEPAVQMLQTMFDAIPNIIAAAIVLGLGVLIARFAGDLLGQVLDGLGTDRALRELQVLPEGRSANPAIAKVVQVGIVLFFAVMAAKMLDFPQITNFLTEVLALGGRVVFGGAVIAAGFFIANLLGRTISGTGGTVIRYVAIVLFTAMGLKFMGIADSIINLAFGALVVGAAAAAALAFGLGGREFAARKLEEAKVPASGDAPADARVDVPPANVPPANVPPAEPTV